MDHCRCFIKNEQDRKISRLYFGQLFCEGWDNSATMKFLHYWSNAFKPDTIPDRAFLNGAGAEKSRYWV
jgi:hypothetical protein